MDLDRFLKILAIEVEHLGEHIRLMMKAYDDETADDVTDRVRQENLVVLAKEKSGFKHLVKLLGSIDVTAYETVDQLTEDLKQAFAAKLDEAGLARAAYLFAERKIEKVARYIKNSM